MAKHNFLCIQRSQVGQSARREAASPAQMDQMYAQFNAWRETFKDSIVDLGGRLSGKSKIVSLDGEIDGPSVEMKEVIGGYMIISAESIEEAVSVVRQCPGVVSPCSSVEVREISMP